MIDKIKRRIALFSIKRLFAGNSQNSLSFSRFFTNSKFLLVCIPQETEGNTYLFYTLDELLKDGKKVTLLVKEAQFEKIKSRSGYSYIIYKDEDLTRLNLPGKELARKINTNQYDLFIDLDFKESLLNYAVAGICNAQYRMGYLKDSADKFYNFQIPVVERNSEISYRNLLNSIRMF
ncbi:MAG: hypothetical protein KKA84_05590 [Bacteroidetes bacterium]|nr:hypothetical protein [Bacteroidota bacterium]